MASGSSLRVGNGSRLVVRREGNTMYGITTSWRANRCAALAVVAVALLSSAAGAASTEEIVRQQQDENKALAKQAADRQNALFQQAEDLFKERRFQDAARFYQDAMNVTYAHWELRAASLPVHDAGGPKDVLLPGTRMTTLRLDNDVSRRALARLASIERMKTDSVYDAILDDAEQMLKDGRFGEAYAQYKKLTEATGLTLEADNKYKKLVPARMKEIEKKAQGVLHGVKSALAAMDLKKSMSLYDEFVQKYGGLETVPTIAPLYDEVADNAELRQHIHESQAADKLAAATALFEKQQYADALEAFQTTATKWPDTTAGKEAIVKLDKMRSDNSVMKSVKSTAAAEEASDLMRKAKNFRANGLKTEAEKWYKRIIERYPDSTAASEAAKALEEMKN
jgi:tetratricopeptide (TPR) repeat protein